MTQPTPNGDRAAAGQEVLLAAERHRADPSPKNWEGLVRAAQNAKTTLQRWWATRQAKDS